MILIIFKLNFIFLELYRDTVQWLTDLIAAAATSAIAAVVIAIAATVAVATVTVVMTVLTFNLVSRMTAVTVTVADVEKHSPMPFPRGLVPTVSLRGAIAAVTQEAINTIVVGKGGERKNLMTLPTCRLGPKIHL